MPKIASRKRASVIARSKPFSSRPDCATARAPYTGRPNWDMIARNALIEMAKENEPKSPTPNPLATKIMTAALKACEVRPPAIATVEPRTTEVAAAFPRAPLTFRDPGMRSADRHL